MMQYLPNQEFRLRSFVRRDSRMTAGQAAAYASEWPGFGLSLRDGFIDQQRIFARIAPCFLEIGFGNGQSLLQLAKMHPESDFIGIETYKPGIGALLLAMSQEKVNNIRIYHADVIDVLTHCLADGSLQGAHIFFPDPWPKRKHHLRRLVQLPFLVTLYNKIKVGGNLHLATDWEDYAKEMQLAMHQSSFLNCFPEYPFSPERSLFRPIITKFEQRALQAGRSIYELQFKREESVA